MDETSNEEGLLLPSDDDVWIREQALSMSIKTFDGPVADAKLIINRAETFFNYIKNGDNNG